MPLRPLKSAGKTWSGVWTRCPKMLTLFVTAVLTLNVATLAEDVPDRLTLDLTPQKSYVTKWLEDREVGLLAMKGTAAGPFCTLMPLPEIDQQLQDEEREKALKENVMQNLDKKSFLLEPIYDVRAVAGEAIAAFCDGRKTILIEKAPRRSRRSPQICVCRFVCVGGSCFCVNSCG